MGFPIAAVALPGSNNVQVFVGGETPAITLSQTGTSSTNGLDSTWSGATPFAMSTTSDATTYSCIAACQNHNGQANLWATPQMGHTLMTRQKASAAAQWSTPSPFSPQPSGVISAIAAGKSVPGRIQLFAALENGAAGHSTMITTWEKEENSGVYYDWSAMEGAPDLALLPAITCVNAPDGRLQLLATNSQGVVVRSWKSGKEANAPWTKWQIASVNTTGVDATSMAGGIDSSGVVYIWGCANNPSAIVLGGETSAPSESISWRFPFFSQGTNFGIPYNVASARLSSGHLIVFLVAAVSGNPEKFALYGILDDGTPSGWVHIADVH
jgi:hypothetical protein